MAYSRKSYWMLRSAMFAIAAIWAVFILLFHPSKSVVPYVAGAVVILVFALTFRAFIYLDEIQRAQRMRVCFYGFMLGAMSATIVLLVISLHPSLLDTLADALAQRRAHKPLEYFALGALMVIIVQTICSLAVSLAMRLKSGA